MFEYSAHVIKVVDGDTADLDVDLGFGVRRSDRFRLFGINAPDKKDGLQIAADATAFLRETLPVGTRVVIHTFRDKREKFGRYLAKVFIPDPITSELLSVNELLVEAGHAVPYMADRK